MRASTVRMEKLQALHAEIKEDKTLFMAERKIALARVSDAAVDEINKRLVIKKEIVKAEQEGPTALAAMWKARIARKNGE